jgi:hypothetical protein
MSGQQVPPQPDDVVAWVTVRVHAHGAVSISGTIADKRMALSLLDHAKDAITRQIPDGGIVIPNRDVDVVPNPAFREMGDIARHERGDP